MINQNFLKTLNVLYVEDSKATRIQFSTILNKLFNKVVIAKDGQEGIEKFIQNQEENFDINVVVSDINMPNMSGMDLLIKIREISDDTPFIITTAHSETNLLLQAIKYKATDYVIKPINTKNLIHTVQKVCQSKYHDNIKVQTMKDLEQLTDTINEVSLVTKTDLNGKITFANKLFCKTSGYKKSEIIGQTHRIVKHPDMDEGVINHLWTEIQKGNIWEGKIQNISRNKKTYHTYASVIPLYDEYDVDIIEFMWICFLTTQEEEEQNEFKKKVVKNVKETRRINLQARQTIDKLQTKLTKYKHFDMIEYALEVEQKRTSKCKSQIKYYEKEVKTGEKRFDLMSGEVHQRIDKANLISNKEKDKKDVAVLNLEVLTKELDAREADVKVLNEEIAKQIDMIEELQESIAVKESQLGMNDLLGRR